MTKIKALFLDVGGVILTNGWDRSSRELAAQTFDLDLAEMNERHALMFDPFEIGMMTLDKYINKVVFYKKRDFTVADFKQFMFSQSKPFPEMLKLMKEVKEKYGLKVVAVSNEGRELMDYRIEKFDLKSLIDFFNCSCYVHLRKPDIRFYQMALDLSQVTPEEVIYVDDRSLLIEVGKDIGFHCIRNVDVNKTKEEMTKLLNDLQYSRS